MDSSNFSAAPRDVVVAMTTTPNNTPTPTSPSTALWEKETSPQTAAALAAAIQAEADADALPPTSSAAAGRSGDGMLSLPPSSCSGAIPHGDGGGSASFTATCTTFLAGVVPPGGIRSSIFNLAGASIGAGILGLPAASNDAGLLLAFLLLLLITVFSVYSMYLLAVAAENTHIHSFEQMGKIVPLLDVFGGGRKRTGGVRVGRSRPPQLGGGVAASTFPM
ncbi:hypothetical protein STCU_12043 [Strigomonas culicis]|uniref:Amino acid transporter transmembrane domain-containing protein n=1 Tax=Strigomonas culicis TaxID=28005 RepID=S9UL52_9TRYP|nr:hypothetical protein STCU_12043 [Strigomonas culicis]|eukprot:EPY15416.1 hypothetical protein STCU_12043 [Strigomonas culicis]